MTDKQESEQESVHPASSEAKQKRAQYEAIEKRVREKMERGEL